MMTYEFCEIKNPKRPGKFYPSSTACIVVFSYSTSNLAVLFNLFFNYSAFKIS